MKQKMYTFPAILVFTLVCWAEGTTFSVRIDTDKLLHVVDDRFLSYTLDAYLMQTDVRWGTFDFRSRKLRSMLLGLAPAYLRVGGTPADFLFFDKSYTKLNNTKLRPGVVEMTRSDWDRLAELAWSSSARLLFEFNLQTRYGSQWDPTNAMELLDYSTRRMHGANLDFELGNEPGFYNILNPDQTHLSGSQIAKDYTILKKLVSQYPELRNSSIVGPDVMYGAIILKEFLEGAGNIIRAITIHHYYFSGTGATYREYINPFYFDNFPATVNIAKAIIRGSRYPDTPLWVGEGADAMNSGTQNVSDRFVSGFLWLEKLGMAAKLGVDVVMRQDLYGHFYGLIDDNMDPNPDYWLSWLHKRLVGRKVLSVELSKNLRDVRVYGHCTSHRSWEFPKGSITVFALNVNEYEEAVISTSQSALNTTKLLYLLEPFGKEGLLSRSVSLNGDRLTLNADASFPHVEPRVIEKTQPVVLPPLTMAFIVFSNANVTLCS